MAAMKWVCFVVLATFGILLATPAVNAISYTGSLTYSYYPPDDPTTDGLMATGEGWAGAPDEVVTHGNKPPSIVHHPGSDITMTWTVDNDAPRTGFPWRYTYTLSIVNATMGSGLSHVIIETSTVPEFQMSDLVGFSSNVSGVVSTLDTWEEQGSSNPNLPAPIYGIKFDTPGSPTDLTLTFWSDRAPVWGDFYAKDGGNPTNSVWNKGLTNPDSDPAGLPANGSVNFSILRPDSYTSGGGPSQVPEPLTMAGLGLGLCGLVRYVRRRR
jgi:hypothetical protein